MTDLALHADAEHEEKAEVAAEEAVEAAPAVHPFGTSGGEHSRAYRCRRWSGATYRHGARSRGPAVADSRTDRHMLTGRWMGITWALRGHTPQNFQKIKCERVEPDGRNRR
jgi:hypothetical protein